MLEYYITPLLNCQHFFSPFLFAFFNYSGCFAESGIFIGFIVMLWRECFIEVGVLLGYWFITLLLLYLWFCCFYFLSRLRCSRVGAESGTMWASSPTGGVMISCVFKRVNAGSSNRAIDFLMFLRTAARAVPTICFFNLKRMMPTSSQSHIFHYSPATYRFVGTPNPTDFK